MESIPFNKPFMTGRELDYIQQAVASGKISGNGGFTRRCHAFMKERFGFRSTLLTSSCTDALEMSALLSDIEPGDEVIMPSFTFVSTANAFVLRGARVVFADSGSGGAQHGLRVGRGADHPPGPRPSSPSTMRGSRATWTRCWSLPAGTS